MTMLMTLLLLQSRQETQERSRDAPERVSQLRSKVAGALLSTVLRKTTSTMPCPELSQHDRTVLIRQAEHLSSTKMIRKVSSTTLAWKRPGRVRGNST